MQFNIFESWLEKSRITKQVQEDFGVYFTHEIVIPVHDADGNFLFNKYRRSPLQDDGPKYRYDKGSRVALYGWHKAKDQNSILVTEGEKDCLVAWSHNIPAVTSTGGAQSFQKDWVEYFCTPEGVLKQQDGVTICYDNDHAGAEGLVKTLDILPWAKVLLLPDMPNVKDISDYVNIGGDLHELMKTARHFSSIEEVAEDRNRRIATFQSTFFHDAYIKAHTKVVPKNVVRKAYDNDKITNARLYPIENLLNFDGGRTAVCPFHNERTGSLHYYPEDNHCYCFGGCGKAYDSIAIYMKVNGVGFKDAVEALQK